MSGIGNFATIFPAEDRFRVRTNSRIGSWGRTVGGWKKGRANHGP